MKINGVNPYRDFIVEPQERQSRIDGNVKLKIENKNLNQQKLNGDTITLSQNEREFFANMFPENSELIKKHVLFNRHGKIETPATGKGTLFDGLA